MDSKAHETLADTASEKAEANHVAADKKATKKRQIPEVADDRRIIRAPEREARTGLSRTAWYRLEQDGKAPARTPLGEASHGWYLPEILSWIEERMAARRQTGGSGGAGQ